MSSTAERSGRDLDDVTTSQSIEARALRPIRHPSDREAGTGQARARRFHPRSRATRRALPPFDPPVA